MELLRALEHRGQDGGLWRDGEGWELGELAELVVPTLVRQVIDIRLARLGPEVREPLALAAMIGQDVPFDLWQRLAGLDDAAMLRLVETAIEWHVVVASADGTRMHFVHALTREALYEGILPPRRRLLHRDVAEALMEQPAVDPDPVAYHLQRAGDPRTAEWMIRAGERAQRAYAWLTAGSASRRRPMPWRISRGRSCFAPGCTIGAVGSCGTPTPPGASTTCALRDAWPTSPGMTCLPARPRTRSGWSRYTLTNGRRVSPIWSPASSGSRRSRWMMRR